MDILIIIILVWLLCLWLFYVWGAGMAQKKGYSRSYGWLAVFLGLIGILIIAVMSDQSVPETYVPHTNPARANVSEQLERLAFLREKGALTSEEFEAKKRELLTRG